MYNSRTPTDPSIIDSVALQYDSKPDFDDDLGAAMDLSGNPAAASTGNKGSHTIEFYALDTRSSPHDFHGIIDKWEIPPRKRGITRTVCRCRSRPASEQPPPAMYNLHPFPTSGLERHQRGISHWHERVRPRTHASATYTTLAGAGPSSHINPNGDEERLALATLGR